MSDNEKLAEACEHCRYPLSEHVGGKPCVVSAPSSSKNIWDLPVFGWAWKEDGKDRRA